MDKKSVLKLLLVIPYIVFFLILISSATASLGSLGTDQTTECSTDYAPICGTDYKTYYNSCIAEKNGIDVLYDGECALCNSISVKNCYNYENCEVKSDTFNLFGFIPIYWQICVSNNGTTVKNLTLEYTSTNTEEIPSGTNVSGNFRKAKWICIDGSTSNSGDVNTCKSKNLWYAYAKEFCDGKCNSSDLCGVDSFTVDQKCPSTTNLSGNLFRKAKWACVDDSASNSGDVNTCKSKDKWYGQAKEFCDGKCLGDLCGIDSFTVTQKCSTMLQKKLSCGDGVCNQGENETSCSKDCKINPICGDGICDAGETTTNCEEDCSRQSVCGDGVCDKNETLKNCKNDCESKTYKCPDDIRVCSDGSTVIRLGPVCEFAPCKSYESIIDSSNLKPSGPVKINRKKGQIIEGLKISSTTGDCIQIIDSKKITIRNSEIGPCSTNDPEGPEGVGRGILMLRSSDIVLDHVKIISASRDCIEGGSANKVTIQSSQIGPCGSDKSKEYSHGIWFYGDSSDLNISDNYIHVENIATGGCCKHENIFLQTVNKVNIQGNVLAFGQANIGIGIDEGASNNVNVIGNFMLNPRGSAYYPGSDSEPLVNAQRGSNLYAEGSNMIFKDNYALSSMHNYTFPENQEDSMNFHVKNFIAEGNYLVGGHSNTGCGMVMDTGADNGKFLNNNLVNTGHCGMGVATGTNHVMEGNRILGLQTIWNGGNIAMFVDNQIAPCGPVRVSNNIATWVRDDGSESSWGNAKNCKDVTLSNNTFDDGKQVPPGGTAYKLLYPPFEKMPPPLIPPGPKNCVIQSPYTTQNILLPC